MCRESRRRAALVVTALALLVRRPAANAFVLGGGAADTDCRVAFGGVDATDGASEVVCADGDASCDADGTADGACRFTVSLCTSAASAGCSPVVIDQIGLTGLPLVPPLLPASSEACGPALTVTVPLDTATGATSLARAGGALRDVDYLNLCCRAAAAPLAAARCALAVDLRIAGCTSVRVPASARARFARARARIEGAAADSARADRLTRRAVRALQKVRAQGRRLARRDDCGYAIGLVASHALAVLGTPGATAPDTGGRGVTSSRRRSGSSPAR
jgi:hypothetical protein